MGFIGLRRCRHCGALDVIIEAVQLLDIGVILY